MSGNVGIVFTGGAVSPPLLNQLAISIAHNVMNHNFTPLIFSGGYSSILTRGDQGFIEVNKNLLHKWKKQETNDFTIDRNLPTRTNDELDKIIKVLRDRNISRMVIIGGNGSTFALSALYNRAPDFFTHMVQVLKTMDGDCQTPFANLGFASTLHYSKDMLNRYRNELTLYGSPYVVKVMGREVGQLAFHLGLSDKTKSGLILIKEELGSLKLTLHQLGSLLIGSALKELATKGSFGSLVLAEGLMDSLTPEAQKEIGVTFNEDRIDFKRATLEVALKEHILERLKKLGVNPDGAPLQVGARTIGYSSRAGNPVDEDTVLAVEYGTRAGTLVTEEKPLDYPTLILPDDDIDIRTIVDKKGEADQCWVDTNSSEYKCFVERQFRLTPDDLKDGSKTLKKITSYTNFDLEHVREELKEAALMFSKLPHA